MFFEASNLIMEHLFYLVKCFFSFFIVYYDTVNFAAEDLHFLEERAILRLALGAIECQIFCIFKKPGEYNAYETI